MKKIHHYHRRFRLSMMKAGIWASLFCALLLPSYVKYEKMENNFFTVSLNGVVVGSVASEEQAKNYLTEARRRIAATSDDLVLIEADLQVSGEERIWGRVNSMEQVITNMVRVMEEHIKETLHRSYTVKINEASVNLASYQDVYELLMQALVPYDTQQEYEVKLVLDDTREINVLTTQIQKKENVKIAENLWLSAGIQTELDSMYQDIIELQEKRFEEYELGLVDIAYGDKVEIVEAYLLEEELQTVDEAVNLVTKEQETQVIYKVKSGDTLSEIALTNNIPMEELIAINDMLEDENTTIRVDQELVITVPEPDLSVIWKEEQIFTEDYEAEIQYVPNDDWYTTQKVTLQEPSAGRRKIVAVTTYKNGQAQDREVLKEEIYAEAIPKIVERGTKIPPTYVKPVSGGRLSSRFGSRSAPTKGASTNHKGVDWALPIGTAVVASNAGTVTKAGWASGYGYAVYIKHADGRETRYAHLSKVLVKAGQTVSQGQRIALSGNTGRSTGPHLHFEIRINGVAVDPLKYLN
ncbi:MAG: M23 family metallopeptidase [Lachnospiraceae bacterium]|nr:M23 family metallopeptidase [Lachnospiraceae bacterium]MBQ6994778.1 M23 family metallopeptidase [Lachnospiraceae bacterium]